MMQDSVFKAASDTQTPQGVLCIVRRQNWELEDLLRKETPCCFCWRTFRTREIWGRSCALLREREPQA